MLKYHIPDLLDTLSAAISMVVRKANMTARDAFDGQYVYYPGVWPAHGTSWFMQTSILVHWAWITLPALLVVLTVIFLAITTWQNQSRRLDVWKSSMVPLLC